MTRRLASAAAVADGVIAALKMICWLEVRRYSIVARSPAMKPPVLASDLEKLPQIRSTRSVSP